MKRSDPHVDTRARAVRETLDEISLRQLCDGSAHTPSSPWLRAADKLVYAAARCVAAWWDLKPAVAMALSEYASARESLEAERVAAWGTYDLLFCTDDAPNGARLWVKT